MALTSVCPVYGMPRKELKITRQRIWHIFLEH